MPELFQPCPACSKIRKALREIEEGLADPIGTYLHYSPPELDCPVCDNTGEALTAEGQKIYDRVVEALSRQIKPALLKLEEFAIKSNPELAGKCGIKQHIPF